MRTESGIQALYQSFASGKDQIMVIEGNIVKIKQNVFSALQSASVGFETGNLPDMEQKPVPTVAEDLLQEKAVEYFKKILSSALKMPASRIEAAAPMEKIRDRFDHGNATHQPTGKTFRIIIEDIVL